MTSKDEQADRLLRRLRPYQARKRWEQWIRDNWDTDMYAPLLDHGTAERDGETYAVARKDKFQSRPVLKRSEGMEKILTTEIRVCLIQFAICSDTPLESVFDELKVDGIKSNIPPDLIRKRLENAEGKQIGVEMDLEGITREIPLPTNLDEGLDGIMYMMFTTNEDRDVIPMYLGVTRMTNALDELNPLINEFADSMFGRWGYGRANHLGALSNEIFEYDGWDSSAKYDMWADEMFVDNTRLMKKPVMFSCQVWGPGLMKAEEYSIKLASKAFPSHLLNIQHRIDNHSLGEY